MKIFALTCFQRHSVIIERGGGSHTHKRCVRILTKANLGAFKASGLEDVLKLLVREIVRELGQNGFPTRGITAQGK